MKHFALILLAILSLTNSHAEEDASKTRDEIAQDRTNQYGGQVKFYGCKNCEFPLNTYEKKLEKLDQGGSGYAEFSVLLKAGTYYDSYLSSAINENLGTLTIQLNSIKSELENLKRELSNSSNLSNQARSEIENKIRDYKNTERNINQLIASFNDLKKRAEESQSGMNECTNDINTNSKIISNYRDALPGAEHVPPDILERHTGNYDSMIANLKEYANLKNQLESLSRDISNSINTISSQHKNNAQTIQNAKNELSGLDGRLQRLNAVYADQNGRYTRITDELNRELNYYNMAKDTISKLNMKNKIDSLQRDARSLESDINRTTSEVRSLASSYQFMPSRLASFKLLDSQTHEAAAKITSGNSYVGPIATQKENVCQLRTKDNQQINPLKKFNKYREELDREVSKTPFTGVLKTSPPMKGYKELVYLKTRQDIIMKWNTVEDSTRANNALDSSEQLIGFSDDYLSAPNKADDSFINNMKSTIMTMQDYGTGALSMAIGFVPYVNHIKDLADVIQGKDIVTGAKYGTEMRMIIMGAMLLPVSVTAIAPFVGKIAPMIMKALKIAENPFTRKVLAAAERLGIKESRDIIRNVKLLDGVESEFSNLAVQEADEANLIYTNRGDQKPYLDGTKIIKFSSGKTGNYVRLYSGEDPTRSWVMLESEVEGMSPSQILDLAGEYNLPRPPTKIAIVTTPPGTEFEMSIVGPNGYGQASGRIQYEIKDPLDKRWFEYLGDL